MKYVRWFLIAVGACLIFIAFSWVYTSVQLNVARSKGVHASAEQGMLAIVDKYYPADRDLNILYAGTNSVDGSKPHIWYVIAEVHATARADGSPLGSNGCDAPGSYFLQSKDGNWVHVSEGAFPTFIGFWMDVFDKAGEGQPIASTDWGADQPSQFCR